MAMKILAAESAGKVVRDTSVPRPRIEPDAVAAALGAEEAGEKLARALAPITLYALRTEIHGRLHSGGGRPALSGTSRRPKIPLGDAEWADLEQLAAELSGPEFRPSPGQVASALLSLSIRAVIGQVSATESSPR